MALRRLMRKVTPSSSSRGVPSKDNVIVDISTSVLTKFVARYPTCVHRDVAVHTTFDARRCD